MIELHTREHGYIEISPPFLVRRDCMIGTSQLPEIRGRHTGWKRISFSLRRRPKLPADKSSSRGNFEHCRSSEKFVAYTPCFRREAGAAGRETRGIIRVHQFDKVELVKITTPEKSYDELESLAADAERVLQAARLALSRRRAVHRRFGFRISQNLRHRSLVAGPERISRSFELFEL